MELNLIVEARCKMNNQSNTWCCDVIFSYFSAGLGAVEQKIMDIISPISPSVLGLDTFQRSHDCSWTVTWPVFSASPYVLPPLLINGTLGLWCCTVLKKIMVLTTTECLLIVIFRVTSCSSIFRNDFWLFRRKKTPLWFCCKKLQWTEIAASIYEWKISFWKMQYLF